MPSVASPRVTSRSYRAGQRTASHLALPVPSLGPHSALICKGISRFHMDKSRTELSVDSWGQILLFIVSCHPVDGLVGQSCPLAKKRLTLASFKLSFNRTAKSPVFIFGSAAQEQLLFVTCMEQRTRFLWQPSREGIKKKKKQRKRIRIQQVPGCQGFLCSQT